MIPLTYLYIEAPDGSRATLLSQVTYDGDFAVLSDVSGKEWLRVPKAWTRPSSEEELVSRIIEDAQELRRIKNQ